VRRVFALVLATAMATAPAAAVTDDDLRAVESHRVLFGHQSVGWNILDGVATVYGKRGVPAPTVLDELPASGPGFAQVEIGTNGDPRSKFTALKSAVEQQNPQVAAMKLCFVDITAGTKVRAVFTRYRATVAALQASNPQTHLVHMTVPLTTNDPASNVVRERYNTLVRSAFGPDVVDIARVESTRPNGSRVKGRHHGKRYYALYRGYASDDGHLNTRGGTRVAKVFLLQIAQSFG
jgi:hypothetical protein